MFPRSAVKAMQAIPLVESGAADAFGLDDTELAIACASHSGDKIHLAAVRGLLAKAGLKEAQLACGVHWPMSERASEELTRAGQEPKRHPQQLLRQACRHVGDRDLSGDRSHGL